MALRFSFCLISFFSFVALAGTENTPTITTEKPTATVNNENKIKFETKQLIINSNQLTVEIADTDEKQELGLMHRTLLKEGEGMLFIFNKERTLSFWMKNTLIDLDIGYFNKDKALVDIQTMKAMTSIMQKEFPSYTSASPAMFALEVPKGWFKKHKIKIGSKFLIK